MTRGSGGSGGSGPNEKADPKAYKVAVVDRDTGGTRSVRSPGGSPSLRPDASHLSATARPSDSPVIASDAGGRAGDGADALGTGAIGPARSPAESPDPADHRKQPNAPRSWGQRAMVNKGVAALWFVAILGVVGTLVFGHAWASQNGQLGQQAQVRATTSDFLIALTNFNAKDIDTDFNRIQRYATGNFAQQSNQFFGSTIRNQLEAALASSRGQIRSQYIQAINGPNASVFSVVDQTYINDKMKSPAADELQIVTNLTKRGSVWKISDVTVLTNGSGAAGAATGAATGAAG